MGVVGRNGRNKEGGRRKGERRKNQGGGREVGEVGKEKRKKKEGKRIQERKYESNDIQRKRNDDRKTGTEDKKK